MSEEVDFYIMKLHPPTSASNAGVDGGALYAFFRRSFTPQDEAIEWFLASQSWTEVPGTRQQLVLSPLQTETMLNKTCGAALKEFREHGFALRIAVHTEDDEDEFDLRRFFRRE